MRQFYAFLFVLISVGVMSFPTFEVDSTNHGSNNLKSDKEPNKEKNKSSKTTKVKKSSNLVEQENLIIPIGPLLTATKSVAIEGGGNATIDGQLNYTIILSNSGASDASNVEFSDVLSSDLTLVGGTLKATPIGVNDAYSVIGNVGITVPVGIGVLGNDVSPDATEINATVTTDVTHGSLSLATDGSFTYNPNAGFSGNDSFVYTVTSANGTSSTNNMVTLTVSAPIWFVNSAASSNGTGTLASPFKDWSDFATSNALSGATNPASGHSVFIYSGTYSGAATLKNSQKVLGQGATTTLAVFAGATIESYTNTLPATSGTNPNLTSTGTTITLGADNTLRGFDMGNSVKDIAGSAFTSLTISEMALNGNGQALDLDNGSLTAGFTNISSTNSADKGIRLNSITGNLSNAGSTTITNPASDGIGIYASSGVISNFGNTNISGSGGAGFTLTGSSSNTSSSTFADLDISPDAGQSAINSQSLGSITCTSGTITTSSIGGSNSGILIAGFNSSSKVILNIVLDSYTTSGTGVNSIGLNLKNASGSFTINGSGSTAGSGGTISNIATKGVNLEEVSNITLKNMNLTNANSVDVTLNASDYSVSNGGLVARNVSGLALNNLSITGSTQRGISGHGVSNFTMTNCTINNSGDGVNEGAIAFTNLSGSCTISGSTITRANEHLINILNTNVTLNLTISNSNISDTQTTPSGTASAIVGTGILTNTYGNSGKTYLTVSNCTLNKIGADAIKTINNDASTGSYEISGCSIDPVNAATSPNDVGTSIEITTNETSVVYANIHDNTKFSANGGNVVTIAPTEQSTIHTKFTNNTITYKAGGISGLFRGIEIFGQNDARAYATISNNVISGLPESNGIMVDNRSVVPTDAGTGRIDAIITGNTINLNYPVYTSSGRCIFIEAGNTLSAVNTVCAKVANNTTSTNGINGHFRLSSNGATSSIKLEGSTDAATAWDASNTPTVSNGGIVSVRSGSTITMVANNTCQAPSDPPVFAAMDLAENTKIEQIGNADGAMANLVKTKSQLTDEQQKNQEDVQIPVLEESQTSPKSYHKSTADFGSGGTITVNGTGSGFLIPTGKSTTITFSATISTTPITCDIKNTATISGSNFTSLNSNEVTTNVIVPVINSGSSISSTNVCSGGTVDLSATCLAASQINWFTTTSSGGFSVSTEENYSPTNITSATSYYASCTIGGCESSRTLVGSVSINPAPTISISTSPAICQGSTSFTIPYTSTTQSPTTYSISGTGITSVTNQTLDASPITVNLDAAATGSIYNYTLTVKNGNGCVSDNVNGSVDVNTTPPPTSPLATPANFVISGTTTLTASGCDIPSTITWYDAANPSVALSDNQPNISSNKTFFAKCTGTNTCISIASSTVDVTYTPCTPLATSPGNVDITWTGLLSTDWNTACNWNPAWVPDKTNGKVIIPQSIKSPVISGIVDTISVMDIALGGLLEISTTGVLNVKGNGGADMGIKVEGGLINRGILNMESSSGTAAEVCIYLKGTGDPYFWNYGITNINSLTEAFEVGAIAGAPTIVNQSGSSEINIKNGVGFQMNQPTDNLILTNNALINYTGSDLIFNFQGTVSVNNVGLIKIQSGTGIVNPVGSEIDNQPCGEIIMQSGTYTNGGITFNLGLIQMPDSYDFTNTGTFTNDGILKANSISGVTNNKLSIENSCPIFTIGGTNDFVVDGIFTDNSASNSAGVYTAIDNVFTADNALATGSQTLFAKITKNSCTKIVPFDFVNKKPSSVSISQTTICETESVSLSAVCSSGTITWYSSASDPMSIGTGNNFNVTPTLGSGITYFASCETANCKSSRVVTSNSLTVKTKPAAPTSITEPVAKIVCSGNTLSLTANGCSGSVLWSDNSTDNPLVISAVGTYTVSAKCVLDGCQSDASVDVTGLEIKVLPVDPIVSDQNVCSGNDITLAATCPTAGTNPVWSSDNSGSNVISPALTNITASNLYYVSCQGTGPTFCTSAIVPVNLTVNTTLTYYIIPDYLGNVYACENGNAEIALNTLNLIGNPAQFQWQLSTGGAYTDISEGGNYSGVTNDTLLISNIVSGMNNYRYRVIISNACNTISSDTTELKVNQLPTIITNPVGQNVCVGNQTILSVVADGSGLSYQWQVNTGSGFANIATNTNYTNVNTPNLRISNIPNGFNNYAYRCLIFNSCQSINSLSATLQVDPTITILGQPVDRNVCQKSSVTFVVNPVHLSSGAIVYQWQRSADNGLTYSNIVNGGTYAGATTSTLSLSNIPAGLNGSRYRCLINSYCQSTGALLTVTPIATVVGQPKNVEICEGNNANFSIQAAGIGLTYRWQVKTSSGSSFVNVSDGGIYQGATSNTLQLFSPSSLINNNQYRCLVWGTSSCDVKADTSNIALITVGIAAEANTILWNSPISTSIPVSQAVAYILGVNDILAPNGKAEFRAGNAILLNPGFEVQAGAVFKAIIRNPCQTTPILNNNYTTFPKEIVK